jgi:hypothetical protein
MAPEEPRVLVCRQVRIWMAGPGDKRVDTIVLEHYVAHSRRLYYAVLCREAHDFTLSGAVLMTTHRVVATRMLTSRT